MTEILGSDDPAGRAGRRRQGPAQLPPQPARSAEPAPTPVPPLPAGLPVELLGDGFDDDPEPGPPAGTRHILGALREPGSLAVASGLCVLASALAGPSYRYDAYPFNQGVSSLQAIFANSLKVRPLHDYLTATTPNILLAVVAVLAGFFALARARAEQPGWVRPLAAGALLAAVLVLALLAVGAYRTSTYDLTVPNPAGATTG